MENPSAPANELKELRLPPFSKEAEDSILGALLVDNSALDIISDKINANDFYDYGNRLIFEHILKLVENDHPADVITVADSLKEMNQEKETGGIEYLNRLADYSPGSANLIRYAEILRDRSIRRKLISVGSEISAQPLLLKDCRPRTYWIRPKQRFWLFRKIWREAQAILFL